MRRLAEGLVSRRDNPRAEMPFLEHLEELRWGILWSLLAVIVCSIAGVVLVLYFDVLELLMRPGEQLAAERGQEFKLLNLSPEGPFIIVLQLSLGVGLLLASPIVVYQAWSFFAPALEKHEKRAIVPAFCMGLVLFAAGVALAYFVVVPLSLRFFTGLLTEYLEPAWAANYYLGFFVKVLIAFGVVFELPVVVLVLSVLGVVTPKFLRTKRRHAIVAILVLASFLSPGDMIQVTFIMMVPLLALYEFSIWLCVFAWRRREERQALADAPPPEDSVAADRGAAASEPTPYDHGDPARRPGAPDGEED